MQYTIFVAIETVDVVKCFCCSCVLQTGPPDFHISARNQAATAVVALMASVHLLIHYGCDVAIVVELINTLEEKHLPVSAYSRMSTIY